MRMISTMNSKGNISLKKEIVRGRDVPDFLLVIIIYANIIN